WGGADTVPLSLVASLRSFGVRWRMPDSRRRRWPKVLAVFGVVLLALYGWLFVQSPSAKGDWALALAEVRRLAQSIHGEKPARIRFEEVATFAFPNAFVRTGDGWGLHPMAVYSYQ